MSDKLIIGFLGRAGAGKTTAAQYLRDCYGAEVVSFAQGVKHLAKDIFGFSDDQLYGKAKDTLCQKWQVTPREMMQRIGEGARNVISKNVWIDRVYNVCSNPGVWAIDDVRYANESIEIIAWGGTIIRLDSSFQSKHVDSSHPSEAEVDSARFDYRIINNMDRRFFEDLDEIYLKIKRLNENTKRVEASGTN